MAERTGRKKRPTFRWGEEVNKFLENEGLSGPKTETLRRFCELMIPLLEFFKRNPSGLVRFRGAPSLSDPAVSLHVFDMFGLSFRLDYNADKHEYVLNFDEERTPRPPKRRKGVWGGAPARNSEAAAQAAGVRQPPRRKKPIDRVILMSYVLRRRFGTIRAQFARRSVTALAESVNALSGVRRQVETILRRAPRIDLRMENIFDLLTNAAESAYNQYNSTTARYARKAYVIGGGVTLLLLGAERIEKEPLWEPSLFGELP